MHARKNHMPSGARYPLFFAGLLVILVGGLTAMNFKAAANVDEIIAVVGFILLAVSVGIR